MQAAQPLKKAKACNQKKAFFSQMNQAPREGLRMYPVCCRVSLRALRKKRKKEKKRATVFSAFCFFIRHAKDEMAVAKKRVGLLHTAPVSIQRKHTYKAQPIL